MRLRILFAVGLVIVMSATARAQEPRLVGRLPEPMLEDVMNLIDAARTDGLPVEPLVDRALEGIAKGAPPDRIAPAVARLADELRVASTALGANATHAELTAAASAIRAGATPESLAQLRALRPDQPLTVPVAVLADLAAAGVAVDDGVAAVIAMARAQDADYVAFRRNVERDIALGASPAAALGVRLRGVFEAADPGTESGLGSAGGAGGRRKIKP